MSSHNPQDKEYPDLRCSLQSLLDRKLLVDPRIELVCIRFLVAEGEQDKPRIVVQLDMKQEDCLKAEQYQGICAILIRYFREEHLDQDSIIIHDTYRTFYLNDVFQVEVSTPRTRLSEEPWWHEDVKSPRLSELEKIMDKDYPDLRCSLQSLLDRQSLLDPKIQLLSIGFFTVEGEQDRPRIVVQLEMLQEDCLKAEQYQGICAILIRYFRKEHLDQDSIIIHDAYRTFYLNDVFQVEVSTPRTRLSAEPIWHEDDNSTRLSEIEKITDNVVYYDPSRLYSPESIADVDGSFGYYGLEPDSTAPYVLDDDESIVYPRGTSLREIEEMLFPEEFNDPEQE